MIGAIIGDIIGSVYEHDPIKTEDFPLFSAGSTFTDDTVLAVAIADSLLNNKPYVDKLKEYGKKYPYAGYGMSFYKWIFSESSKPYGSWGNGSAMRVSPIGFRFESLDKVLKQAEKSAAATHNHPEGIKGAQATAASIFLAKKNKSKKEIRKTIEKTFGYNLMRTIKEIRPIYHFDVSCQGSVPEAIIAFLDSKDYVDTIRKAVSLGGDSDTLACIAGGIAEAFYKKLPQELVLKAKKILPIELLAIVEEFDKEFGSYELV